MSQICVSLIGTSILPTLRRVEATGRFGLPVQSVELPVCTRKGGRRGAPERSVRCAVPGYLGKLSLLQLAQALGKVPRALRLTDYYGVVFCEICLLGQVACATRVAEERTSRSTPP